MVREKLNVGFECERIGCGRTFAIRDLTDHDTEMGGRVDFVLGAAIGHEDRDSAHLRIREIDGEWGIALLTKEGDEILNSGLDYPSACKRLDILYEETMARQNQPEVSQVKA